MKKPLPGCKDDGTCSTLVRQAAWQILSQVITDCVRHISNTTIVTIEPILQATYATSFFSSLLVVQALEALLSLHYLRKGVPKIRQLLLGWNRRLMLAGFVVGRLFKGRITKRN